MGEVYRAKDTRLDRDVAIKVLPRHLAGNPEALRRFEREARAVAALSHPNIVALYDVGTEQGVSYAVTELLEGETLRDRLARTGRGSPDNLRKAVEIAVEVADGLSVAHAKGIIHRDLKPENIFLTSDGRVKILDFGLARFKAPSSPNDPTAISTETEAGTVMGTVGYMSPEQVRGERADVPSDIFSLGCVLYEMLAGRRAFARETAAQTMAAILEVQPPVDEIGAEIPPGLTQLLRQCLEKSPQNRLQSAHDLSLALKAAGEPDTESNALARQDHLARSVWIAVSLAVLLAAAWVYWQNRPAETIDSLAVLPFVNVGDDPNTEYLSDGISENLINSLSQLPGVRVVPRSLVFAYKGRDADPRKVGRDLNVRAVLMGRVVQHGQSLNIQAELVDVTKVSQLWGQQYDRTLSDIIVVQEQIERAVASHLGLRQSESVERTLTRRYTESPEAHQFYLKGRYLWNRRTAQTLQRAAEDFQRAIDIDPTYGLAWAGLADCYNVYSFYGIDSSNESMPRAKEAARRALAIDDTLAEAHVSAAYPKRHYDWDWAGAEREFRRAIELNPNYVTALHWYGTTLWSMGRLEDGMRELRRAQQIDPLSLIVASDIGRGDYYAGRDDQAIEELRRTLDEIDPRFAVIHLFLGMLYEHKGRYDDAIAEFRQWSSLLGGPDAVAGGSQGHTLAVSGRRSDALAELGRLIDLSRRRYVSPYEIALIHIGLGDREKALEWLEKGYDDHAAWMIWLDLDPRFNTLHGEPRYRDLLQKMHLPLDRH
jgi:eukaryotic-like serine/threonine-protein kinase